jgi:hypothetical protein
MSHDIFNQRIARINNHNGRGRAQMAHGDGGTATSMYSSRPVEAEAPGIRSKFKPMIMGAVLGMIAGTIAAGLENPAMPWGPGSDFNEMIVVPALLALCAGPVMAITGSVMRARFPSLFFFAAAYFPCVTATALLDLPLY